MGTLFTILGTYYVLNGQVFKAAGEVAGWIRDKLS